MDRLELKAVSPGDQEAVLAVYLQCEDFLGLGPQPEASPEMVAKDIAEAENGGGVFRGIYRGGTIIGVASYIPGGFEGKPEAAFFLLLMVAAPFRSQGIGTAIVKMVEKEIMKNKNIKNILSGVQVNNPDAVRFWQKNGYRIIGGPELMPDSTTVFHLGKATNK
ncbi:MAG: GNAT family N-acetyltransferase [Dehalococcoidales bacterium]